MSVPLPGVAYLERLQQDAVGYFRRAANPDNGLIADSSREGSPCSIAATGLGLAVWVVAAERGFLSRREAAQRTLAALRFFQGSPQGVEPDATGYRGFYYHFLDMKTGRRVWQCELSMIDTAILIAGVLSSAGYFSAAADDEPEIRALARFLYERIDWPWATADGPERFCRHELEIAPLLGRYQVLSGNGQRALADRQAGRHKVKGGLRQRGHGQGCGEPAQASLPPM